MSLTTVNITSGQLYLLNPPSNNMTYYSIHMESVDGAAFNVDYNYGCNSDDTWTNMGMCSGRCVFPYLPCSFIYQPSGQVFFRISWTPSNSNRTFIFGYSIDQISPISIDPNTVLGGSLTSGQIYFFHYNSSTSSSGSPNYWSPLSTWSFSFVTPSTSSCGGSVSIYESWIVPGISACSSVFNTLTYNYAAGGTLTWENFNNVYLVDIDYWIIVVPQWDLDINHVPLPFYIEVTSTSPTVYIPIHENEIHQVNFSLTATPDSLTTVCNPDFVGNTLSCSNGCNPPSSVELTTIIPKINFVYETLHTGSALDDRIIFFSTPSYVNNMLFSVLINEGQTDYSKTCSLSGSSCSLLLSACTPSNFHYDIEAVISYTNTNINIQNIPSTYGHNEIPLVNIWVERFAPPVTIIKGTTTLTQFYIDVEISDGANQYFKVVPPDNYPTFVGYMFEITSINQESIVQITEGWNKCTTTSPSFTCGCDPNNPSSCFANTAACLNSPPSVCTLTNRLGSCSNSNTNIATKCQPWVVSKVDELCDFCSGLNTFFISGSNSMTNLITFQLSVTVLPNVTTPPHPPTSCVTIPPYINLFVPYWRIQPWFYIPSLTPSGPDQYYFFQFTTNAPEFLLSIVEYPVPFNESVLSINPGGSCNYPNQGSSSLEGFNNCNLLYQPTNPGAKPMIMVVFINFKSLNSYYFYINESLTNVNSIQIQLDTTQQSPSITVPCETPTYNLHYVIPSYVLSSVTALMVEVVGNGVSVLVYKDARSLNSVIPTMTDTQPVVGSCDVSYYDCRIIISYDLNTTANYFIEVNAVPNNITVTSLGSITPINLAPTAYATLSYDQSDPTQNDWLTYSFDTSSPPYPLAGVQFDFTGDQNPWIIITSTSTSSNILSTDTGGYIYQAMGNGDSTIVVTNCQFSANTPIYANVLPLIPLTNCRSNAFQISAQWESTYNFPPVTYDSLPFGSVSSVILNFTFSTPAEPEALLVVKGFSLEISYSLWKGNIAQSSVKTACSSSCSTSTPNQLPSTSSLWMGGFNNGYTNRPPTRRSLNSVGYVAAQPRLRLDVYDSCFHCGDTYDTFYLYLDGPLPANSYPTIQKLLPTVISSTPVSMTIGDVTAPGLAYFAINPLDITKGQYIEIKVTSGFVMGVLYPYSSTCPMFSNNNNYRYKWCYEGETCRIIMAEPLNFPIGSSFNRYYLQIYGASTFSVALLNTQNTVCVGISSSQAPYCNGYTYSPYVLVFDNQIYPHDQYASQLSVTIQNAFLDNSPYNQLTSACINAIRNFACGKGFEGCDSNGLVSPMPASICNTIESACGVTMNDAGFPQFSCNYRNYTGNENFLDLDDVNGARSQLDSITFLLILLAATILHLTL